jgi:hypothetical protein
MQRTRNQRASHQQGFVRAADTGRCTASSPMKLRKYIDGRFFGFAAAVCLLLSAPHCQDYFERDTKIEMDGKNPPTFTFSGNGQVDYIDFSDESVSDVSYYSPERKMWQLVPTGNTTPDRFPKITYGVVPPGFVQRWPAAGPARPLDEEKPYLVAAPTSNANAGTLMFLIRNGQALPVVRGADRNYYIQTPKP